MNLIPDIIMKKITSLAQIERHHSGEWENEILELGEPYGVVDAKKERVLDPLTGKWFELDARLGDILIELTTSCGDTKEAKTIREATLFKENNPGSKFVVCLKRIKSNKGKGRVSDGKDSHYDHLIKHPDIDNVLVGEEEIIKFFIKPTWDKQEKINKLKNKMKNKTKQTKKGDGIMSNDINAVIIREAIKVHGNPVNFIQEMYNMNITNMPSIKSSTESMKNQKKDYFNLNSGDNVEVVESGYEDFMSLEELGYKNVSRFMGTSIASRVMEADDNLLALPNGLAHPKKYGISRKNYERFV
jgi:hypothetical protein